MMSQQAANAGPDRFETAGTLVDAVFGEVARWGDRPAVIDLDGGDHVGYARLAETIRAAAGGLLRRGLRPGDAVGLDVRPSPQCVTAAYAVLAAGGVIVPVGGGGAEAAHLSAHDARLLLAAPGRADAAIALAERTRVRQVIAMEEATGATSFAELIADGAATATCPMSPESPALLPVGGAGPYDHRSLLARAVRVGRVITPTDLDTVLVAPPPGDGAALLAVLSLALLRGATVLTSATMDLTRCRRVVADQRVRFALLGAPVVRALAGPRLAAALPSLAAVFSAAPPLVLTRDDPRPRPADAIV